MILVDTSVWVDYLRGADTAATGGLRKLLADAPGDVTTCEPIAMEVLAGARDPVALARLERLVDGLPSLAVETTLDFRTAAVLYRAYRASGRTVRSLSDCLIAAIALRHDATIWHNDVAYEVLAGIAPLRHVRLT